MNTSRMTAWWTSHISRPHQTITLDQTLSPVGSADPATLLPTSDSAVYPDLAPQIQFPLITRMLLYGDGSTTVLLQQIAGTRIVAEVLPVRTVVDHGHRLHREVFPGVAPTTLRLRHTRLRNEEGGVISENIITYRDSDERALIPPNGIPFGIHIRRLGAFERRRIFDTGITRTSFGLLPEAAAARAYEIAFSTKQRVLVHEVFNPAVIPTRSEQ